MRFEVGAGFAVGVLLPVLETCRRGISFWRIEATTLLEDYAAGALLLVAAFAAMRGRPYGARLLLTAWAGVAAIMSLSFVHQVESTVRGTDLEPHNTVVLAFKLALWLVSAIALVGSFRAAGRTE